MSLRDELAEIIHDSKGVNVFVGGAYVIADRILAILREGGHLKETDDAADDSARR